MGFTISGFYPPAIIISPTSGIKYAVSGSNWVKIPEGVTDDEVRNGWTYITKVEKDTRLKDITEIVVSSRDPNVKYTVRFRNTGWSCECEGFGWRHKCHHITKTKKKHGIE